MDIYVTTTRIIVSAQSASNDLYEAVAELLGQEGALQVNVPIVQRRTKDAMAEIDAAAANHGLYHLVEAAPADQRARRCSLCLLRQGGNPNSHRGAAGDE